MLRPRPARWFEILAARDDATLVLEALARTGAVELEPRQGAAAAADVRDAMPLLAQLLELATRYRAYWPSPAACPPSAEARAPHATLERCLTTIRAWAQVAEPVMRALERNQAERAELQRWRRVLEAIGQAQLDVSELVDAGPVGVRLVVLPAGGDTRAALPPDAADLHAVTSPLDIDGVPHLLVAGQPEALAALVQRVGTLAGSTHELPHWLGPDAHANRIRVEERRLALEGERADLALALDEAERRFDLRRALGDAHRVQWLSHHVHALEAGHLFCWITGWTSDASGDRLAQALQGQSARALVHFPTPPPEAQPPLLLSNPPWARPFELFSRALGMPTSTEADPTPLLAIVMPLMFGYMFGDVGQGLVLAGAGWWYRRRFPIARLLMVGGVAAAAFGFLFGSVFGLHDRVPALWVHPLGAPLWVLVAPIAGGAVLLTVGLSLDALASAWRGDLRRWLSTDVALIVVYLGLLATFVAPAGPWVAASAALYFCVGHAVLAGRVRAAMTAMGELVEKTVQILINTLSFARVGAFALAHAGLSSAIVALVHAADSKVAQAVVLVVGNVVVIVLEAMVVSIQTTRLVLFEFFTRFMQGRGRSFRPLPPPPFVCQES